MTSEININDDHQVVNAILMRDRRVTQQFLYIKCFPLFKSIFDNYFTDCQSCVEFINEIYIHLLTPDEKTNMCRLQSFKFGSSLTTWIKTVTVYYCYERYRRKPSVAFVRENSTEGANQDYIYNSSEIKMYEEPENMGKYDLEKILELMPNKRYSLLLRLLYLEGWSKEKTAGYLQMNMSNFYNIHLRAKNQFNDVLKKEENYGRLF